MPTERRSNPKEEELLRSIRTRLAEDGDVGRLIVAKAAVLRAKHPRIVPTYQLADPGERRWGLLIFEHNEVRSVYDPLQKRQTVTGGVAWPFNEEELAIVADFVQQLTDDPAIQLLRGKLENRIYRGAPKNVPYPTYAIGIDIKSPFWNPQGLILDRRHRSR